MHELSIALSILDLADEEAQRRQVRIAAIHLRLGPLAGVVKDALLSAYSLAREGTDWEKTDLVIDDVPLEVNCPSCATVRRLASPQLLCCPECGTPTPDIVRGRELEVVALEVEP